jgi:hypothetical protein
VEESLFNEQLKALGVSHYRLDDVLQGITEALCYTPESFEAVPGTKLRAFKTAVYPNCPSLRIFFYVSADDQQIHLLCIELCDDVTPFIQYEET